MALIYSQIRAFRGLFWASFKSLLRSPSLLLFNLIFPLILIYGVQYIPSPMPKTAVIKWVDQNNPDTKFLQELAMRKYLTVKLDSQTDNKKVDALLSWNDAQQSYVITYKTIDSEIQNLVYDAVFLTDRRYLGQQHPIQQIFELYSNTSINQYRNIQILQIISFIVFTSSILGVAFSLFHLRQNNVFKLIFATPIHKLSIISAEIFSRFLFIFSSAFISLILGLVILGGNSLMNISNFFWILSIVILGIWSFMPYGFLVSIFAKSIPAVPIIGNIFLIPQWIFSGLFINITNFPNFVQKVSQILPFSCFYHVLVESGNSTKISFSLLYLVFYGLLGYILSFKFFHWN